MKKPTMFLFTIKFPYDKGEEFLENEIPIISKYFDIIIVPYNKGKEIRRIPKNVKVDDFFAEIKSKKNILFYGIMKNRYIIKEFIDSKNIYFYKSIKYFGLEEIFKKWFEQYKNISSNIIFYSYWMTEAAYALGKLRRKLSQRNILISRAHRFDLYEYLYKGNYLPLRKKILKNIDKVFCVSENGKNYLLKKYPQYTEKIEISRLGVMPQNKTNEPSKDGNLRIVTCSYLKPVKRVHLVIDALSILSKKIKKNIIWTHIGDGPLEEELKSRAQKLDSANIFYKFSGRMENKDVQKYYRENPIDLFLNVSESEGLPVSIMEALSFGIPVMATAVGGTPELVDDKVGKLLPADLTPDILAESIKEFINLSDEEIELKRKNALKRWNEKVNAIKNYEDFSKRILELLDER
ncbi:glycosyltransferase [Marinitoga sp. 1138]|uniref:glycosyltransferase n=1 Tax=Marinitoga sp. 1138 TaxID=1643334 RepID=UPI00158678FD|nr:glycosyltransferase [Marinitoga sp. 1138]NUU97733.1 hypothetical protein [Marinitoga sp. 1138]